MTLLRVQQKIVQQTNKEIDSQYLRLTNEILSMLHFLSYSASSPLQISLKRLQAEAQRLFEAGEYFEHNNPVMVAVFEEHLENMLVAQKLIIQNAESIEEAGSQLGVLSSLALLFYGTAANEIFQGRNPLDSIEIYESLAEEKKLDLSGEPHINSKTKRWKAHFGTWASGYDQMANNFMQSLVTAKLNPIYIFQKIKDKVESMTIFGANKSLTTLHRNAYREGSANFEMNNKHFISKKIRIAVIDERTCLGCIELHGTEIPLGEPVSDHDGGRCQSILIPKSMDYDVQTGLDIWNGFSEERQMQQQAFNGGNSAMWNAYVANGRDITKLTTTQKDRVYGGENLVQGSIIGLFGEQGQKDYYLRNQKDD